jgi:hypothetical protein
MARTLPLPVEQVGLDRVRDKLVKTKEKETSFSSDAVGLPASPFYCAKPRD